MSTNCNTDPKIGNDSKELFPTPIRDLLRIAKAFNADPLVVAATGFAVTAAALGGSHRIQVPNGAPVLPGFNLVLVGCQDRGLPWLYPILQPLFARVHEMMAAWGHDRGRSIAKIYEARNRDYQAAVVAKQSPDLLRIAELEVCRLRAAQRPLVLAERLELKHIQSLAPRAFDGVITTYPGGTDLFENWLALKPQDRRELARILNLSWQGIPGLGPVVNVFGAGVPTRTAANALLGFPNKPPILFVNTITAPKIATHLDTKGWSDVINSLFDLRCAEANKVVSIAPDAEAELVRYGQEAETDPWFADLARRLAFLCAHLDGAGLTAESARRGIAITRELAGAHTRTVAAMRPLTHTDDVSTRFEEKLLALITAKGPLTRQQLWRSLNDPKAETFNAALQALITRGDVVIENKQLTAKCGGDS
jgi:hypothetical protein